MFLQTLRNGMRVALDPRPLGKSAVYLRFNRGTLHEEKYEIAHLLEHVQGVECGVYGTSHPLVYASANAETGLEHTAYYFANILPEDVSLAVEFLARVFKPVKPDLIEREKHAVRHELTPRINPGGDASRAMWMKIFPRHMEKVASIEDRLASLDNLSFDDLDAFAKKFYRPVNATLVISGSIPLDIQSLLMPYASLPMMDLVSTRSWPQEEPFSGRHEMINYFREDNMMSIGIAFPHRPFADKEQKEALAAGILMCYLDDSTGPLQRRLRQIRGLCYGAGISTSKMGNTAASTIFTQSAKLDAASEIEEEVNQIVVGLKRDGIPDGMFDTARKRLLVEAIDAPRQFGIDDVVAELECGFPKENRIDLLQGMNQTDILAVANRIFGPDYLVSIALPKK